MGVSGVDGRSRVPDGGWGWVVTFASCIGLILSVSFLSNNGIFYTYIMEDLHLDLTSLTLIGSTHGAICMTAGFGAALSYVSFFVAVDKYFDKKRSIAMPLATSGASLSFAVFSPISEILLSTYGFNGAMLIYSATMLNIVVCGAVVFPLEHTGHRKKPKDKEPLDLSFCKTPAFIFYLIANFLFTVGYFIPSGLLPETAVSKHVDLNEISITFAMSGLMQVIGRLVFGFLSHRYPSQIKRLWSADLAIISLTMLIVPFSNNVYHFLIFNLLSGFFFGGANLGFHLSLRNITEPQYYGRAIAFAFLMQGLGTLVGNPLAAFLQDVTSNGDAPYYFGTVIFGLASLLLLPFTKPSNEAPIEIEVSVSEKDIKNKSKSNKNSQISLYLNDGEPFTNSYI